MSELHVSYIQANLHWESPNENLQMFEELIGQVPSGTDLIVLPEMFTTGFSMAPEKLAETKQGESLQWMKRMASKTNGVITGSLIIEENGHYFNRLFWVRPDGTYEVYDKRHLFSLAGEENHYTAGEKRVVVELKGFKIMPLICYDLRFPVWSRNDLDYDVLLYVANWPERRSYFWSQLLVARAIENQAYVIGVNRVGNDGNDIFHSGNSVCLDPLGEIVSETTSGEVAVKNVVISKPRLSEVRNKFRFLNDKDSFIITR